MEDQEQFCTCPICNITIPFFNYQTHQCEEKDLSESMVNALQMSMESRFLELLGIRDIDPAAYEDLKAMALESGKDWLSFLGELCASLEQEGVVNIPVERTKVEANF